MDTVNDLIDNAKIYQLVTERLDYATLVDDKDFSKISTPLESNHELIALVLDLYKDEEGFPFEKMQKISIEDILTYLQTTHRYYLSKKLPEIEQSLLHIFSKYGQSHQLLASLAIFFNEYKGKLIDHIRMEEKQLFPYIKKMIEVSKENKKATDLDPTFSIEKFIASHSPIEDELREVNKIIKHHSENDMPLPYKIFLNQVELFELELRKHAIIEDYVLVPMVIELEKMVK